MTDLPSTAPILRLDDLTPVQGCTLVIGNFDGVHRGHQALIDHARSLSGDRRVVVLTFEPHPREFFAQSRNQLTPPFRLTLTAQKEKLLRAYGADNVVMLDFDSALSQLTAQAFVKAVIVNGLGAAHVCVGDDFAFGVGRGGTVDTLRHEGVIHGFGVTALPPVRDYQGQPYASSRVRHALAAGDFAMAQDLLGHAWCVSAPVVKGDQRGRTLGYPTANQNLARLQLPPYGIYAVRARLQGEQVWRDAVANLGIRPMFAVPSPLLETYIFDFDQDIYGKILDVQPVEFIRGEAKFDSLDALMAQMKQDCVAARAVLKSRSL